MEEMNELFLLMTDFIFKDCHLQNNHAFEFIGKVQQDLSVRVLASTDFGPEGNIGMISHCSLTLVLGPLISFFFLLLFRHLLPSSHVSISSSSSISWHISQ